MTQTSYDVAIDELLERRVEACRAKDIDALMSLYADDIVYYDVIAPLQFIGTDEVRRNFVRWFDEYDGPIGLETQDQRVAVSGDVAFAHMLHLDSGTRRNGLELAVWVHSTVCLRHINNHWLITHEHISIPHDLNDWTAVVDATP
ncbi:nuclear transport factor 2 family protein [Kribbella sp. NPDC050820]|uniref:YybH family protein n=1 Tax=Kribbella sp. NPDC050820 TaxID=3155408 RepID=UPI00340E79BF